jgi:alpha-beta hydrolase superfamily lysophospholipase
MSAAASGTSDDWTADILGPGYEQQVIELGDDPDGEGEIAAVVVRRGVVEPDEVHGAVLYLPGFSDYFFQTDLADFFAARAMAFYALDLRKCGRARRSGQTAHYVSDLARYDVELDRVIDIIAAEHPGQPLTIVAHSTGGLIAPLYLDRRRRAGRLAPVTGLVLNSPWFDLQGKPLVRGPLTWALRPLARLRPFRVLKLPQSGYGDTLHTSGTGEWEYVLDLKPSAGFPVTLGWLNAVRRGHARLHRGLDVGVPALVLRSDRSHFSSRYSDASDHADTVLDVRQIARWSGCLGGPTSIVPIAGARHDVFLSLRPIRDEAYAQLDGWLQAHPPVAQHSPVPTG